jgi:hypothetical protein
MLLGTITEFFQEGLVGLLLLCALTWFNARRMLNKHDSDGRVRGAATSAGKRALINILTRKR